MSFLQKNYDLDVKIIRPFNIYGIGQNTDFLIPKVVKQAFTGHINLENPDPKRDFIHLADVIQAYVQVGSVSNNESIIFNIGSGTNFSVDEIVKKVVNIIGKKIKISYSGNVREGEIKETLADVKLAKEF